MKNYIYSVKICDAEADEDIKISGMIDERGLIITTPDCSALMKPEINTIIVFKEQWEGIKRAGDLLFKEMEESEK